MNLYVQHFGFLIDVAGFPGKHLVIFLGGRAPRAAPGIPVSSPGTPISGVVTMGKGEEGKSQPPTVTEFQE